MARPCSSKQLGKSPRPLPLLSSPVTSTALAIATPTLLVQEAERGASASKSEAAAKLQAAQTEADGKLQALQQQLEQQVAAVRAEAQEREQRLHLVSHGMGLIASFRLAIAWESGRLQE